MAKSLSTPTQRAMKRSIITGYCWHILPAWLVRAMFAAFRLGAA
ncbi:hypothetical protein ACM9XA_11370 [Xanthomonas sacchari]